MATNTPRFEGSGLHGRKCFRTILEIIKLKSFTILLKTGINKVKLNIRSPFDIIINYYHHISIPRFCSPVVLSILGCIIPMLTLPLLKNTGCTLLLRQTENQCCMLSLGLARFAFYYVRSRWKDPTVNNSEVKSRSVLFQKRCCRAARCHISLTCPMAKRPPPLRPARRSPSTPPTGISTSSYLYTSLNQTMMFVY